MQRLLEPLGLEMTDTSIRVSDNTRRRLNRYRVEYDLSQNDAIQKLLDEADVPEVDNAQ